MNDATAIARYTVQVDRQVHVVRARQMAGPRVRAVADNVNVNEHVSALEVKSITRLEAFPGARARATLALSEKCALRARDNADAIESCDTQLEAKRARTTNLTEMTNAKLENETW